MSNSNLHKAKRAKNDGFYTQLVDIEKELSNYPGAFEDKIVYCNCDDPNESNFVKYFKDNFEQFEILGQVDPNIGGRKVYVRILIRRK